MVNGYWQQRNCTDSCDTYIEEMECPAGELQFLNPTNYSLNDTVGQINSIKNEYVVPIANFMPIIITLLAIFVFIALLIGVVSYSHHR
jgi:hypothetical protein